MLTDENYKDLEEIGHTVLNGVLTEQECDDAIADYRTWLAHFGDTFPETYHSLIKTNSACHLEVTWRLRLKAKPLFAQLWKTEKLSTSFDAIAIGRPPEDGAEEFQDPDKNWFHADFTPSRVGEHAYQGALYLEEQTENDWTFQVMQGSHKMLEEFFEKFPEREDSVRRFGCHTDLNTEEVLYFRNAGCTVSRVPVPKGGFVLWDSRLVHANAAPLPYRKQKDRWRFVVFISMTPAIWANEKDIEKHQEAYNKAALTTHWSSQGIVVIDVPSELDGPATVPDTARTEEAMKLSAMLPYDYNDGRPNGDEFRPVWKRSSDVSLPPELDIEKEWANGHI